LNDRRIRKKQKRERSWRRGAGDDDEIAFMIMRRLSFCELLP